MSDQASEKIGTTNVKIMDDQRDHSSGIPVPNDDSYHDDFEDEELDGVDRGSAKFETVNGDNNSTQRSADLKPALDSAAAAAEDSAEQRVHQPMLNQKSEVSAAAALQL